MTAALKTPPTRKPAAPGIFAMQREVIRSWQYEDWGHSAAEWEAYCADRFYLLRAAELSISSRRLLVRAFRLVGMSEAAIASALGKSKSTIHDDRVANGDTDEITTVSLDGSRRAANTGRKPTEPAPEPDLEAELAMSHTDRAVYLAGLQGDRGLTVLELRLLTDWHHGNASGTMSRVCRQGRVQRTGQTRLGYGVYSIALVGER